LHIHDDKRRWEKNYLCPLTYNTIALNHITFSATHRTLGFPYENLFSFVLLNGKRINERKTQLENKKNILLGILDGRLGFFACYSVFHNVLSLSVLISSENFIIWERMAINMTAMNTHILIQKQKVNVKRTKKYKN